MNSNRISRLAGWMLMALLAAGCGAAGKFSIVPPEVAKAKAPDDKYKDVHAIYLYDIKNVHYDPIDIGKNGCRAEHIDLHD